MVKGDVFLPMASGTIFYSVLNLVVYSKLSIPETLSIKDRKDFVGHHISLVHSVEAITLCIISYIYSNGIDYYGETDYLQV